MSQNWRARVAAEFGQPLSDIIEGFKDAGHSINSTAQIIGISHHTLRRHCERVGIEFERGVQRPDRLPKPALVIQPKMRMLTFSGQTLHLREWERRTGINHTTIIHRLDKMGWSVDRALTQPAGLIKPKQPKGGRDHWKRKAA